MSSDRFSVPRDGSIYVAEIRERCASLVASGIWKGISLTQLRTWLRNFAGEEEEYFAACLLDSLIYRSADQTRAMMEHLFTRTIPDLCSTRGLLPGNEESLLPALRQAGLGPPTVMLVPVIRPLDPPTKSGPLLARLYRQYLGFNQRNMTWPWMIHQWRAFGTSIFVFVDDFLGTGLQFHQFAVQFNLQAMLAGALALYVPLVAHHSGLRFLQSNAPWLHLCAAEALDETYSLFNPKCLAFQDGQNSPAKARSFYFDLLRRRGLGVSPKFAAGWGHLAMAYVFEHATPDNSLPLFWHEASNWSPLFPR